MGGATDLCLILQRNGTVDNSMFLNVVVVLVQYLAADSRERQGRHDGTDMNLQEMLLSEVWFTHTLHLEFHHVYIPVCVCSDWPQTKPALFESIDQD